MYVSTNDEFFKIFPAPAWLHDSGCNAGGLVPEFCLKNGLAGLSWARLAWTGIEGAGEAVR